MAVARGNQPYKVRNSRWKTLTTLLYHRALKRPTGDTVDTGPSELTRLSGINKVHITVDNLKWLEDMGYISDVECRYGSVKLRVNTELLAIKQQNEVDPPESSQMESGSPSDSALAGGVVISRPPRSFIISGSGMIEVAKYRLGQNPECEHNTIECTEDYENDCDHYKCMDCEATHTVLHYKENEGEKSCPAKQQEPEAEDQKNHSESLSPSSTSQAKPKSRLRRPSTTE